MSEKHITEMKKLKPGGFVLIDELPCAVEKVQKSKAGKHGAAKARLFARGIFDNQKKIIVAPADTRVEVPMIEKRNMQVVALLEKSAQLMDLEDFSQTELPIPEDLQGNLVEGDEVLVWKFDRYAMIKQKR
jgi:translation initiation factor 5A